MEPTPARPRGRRRQSRIAIAAVALLAGSTFAVLIPSAASGETLTNVRVVIERVEERGCTDTFDGSDFYSRVTIDGNDTNFGEIEDEDEISPNWIAEHVVDADVTTSVPVVVKISDSDGFLNFDDDICDLTAGPGDDLHLTVDLTLGGCTVTGDVSGQCDSQLTTTGGGDESVFVRFRVEADVDAPPQTASDALVRCTHSPLWPQPGDTVTITAEALDPALNVGDTIQDTSTGSGPPLVNRTVLVDQLEIWVNDKAGPDQVATTASTTTFTVPNVNAGDLVYSCKVATNGEESFTGWRRTRVGPPEQGSAVPVLLTGGRANRVDVVLIADGDDFTGAADTAFQTAVASTIQGAHFGEGFFLARQQGFNFWLATGTGDSEVAAPTPSDPNATKCQPQGPANWATDYSWADTGAVLHANTFRDCASNGMFTSEPTSLGTVLHETGHSPFGLPDEYCCDGGYWENTPNPTMFDTQAECEADAPNLGRTAADCRSIAETDGPTWWVSEPDPDDLMNSDRRPPRAGDIRRMDWFLTECLDGNC
ncbi:MULTISPECIES: hypothetical protein [Microbacterium]|uniref:hypothetical protein n=1 Tax=Microbacterium TaxID=33882 RepID=UPI000D65A363|nr:MULTISPECIES: hypothetical protein [Microbacterium]